MNWIITILIYSKLSHSIIYIYRYENKEVNLIRTDIAWPTDRKLKFSNPIECKGSESYGQCLKEKFSDYAKPKNWKRNLWELDTVNPENNGLQNEDLIVWMRAAAFPSFRKPYRKINHTDPENSAMSIHFKGGIPKGKYSLIIKYNFEVSSFSGGKDIILSTLSIFGGKNPFLGIAYTVVGCCCLLLGSVLVVSHKLNGNQLENDVDIVAALASEHTPDNIPKILLEVASNDFLSQRN